MKKLIFILTLVLFSQFTYGQYQNIKNKQFNFNIKKNYKIDKSDPSRLFFTDTITKNNYKFAMWILVTQSYKNASEYKIKDIADCSKLGEIVTDEIDPIVSQNIQGNTEIHGKKIYYNYELSRTYFNYSKNTLKNIKLRVTYYLLQDGILYELNYNFQLLNEQQVLNEDAEEKFRHNSNVGDLNVVLESLEIKQ
jgi:hypothetical protein